MQRITAFFQAACTILVISVALFLLVNWAMGPFVPADDNVSVRRPTPDMSGAAAQQWIDHYGLDVVRRVYPGKSDEEIRKIVFNKFQVGNRYEPFVEFLQDPVYLKDTGVHEIGFRFGGKEQGPWPIDRTKLNVFVFGGSTTFGTGAPDEETISANLQRMLTAKLGRQVYSYNFGVGAYYSSQEVINFWRLARQGFFPDLVVFIDGLNDYYQTTEDTAHSGYYREFERVRVDLLKQLQADRGPIWHIAEAVELSPAGRLVKQLKTREMKPNTPGAEASAGGKTILRTFDSKDEAHVRHVTERLLNNFKLAAGMASAIDAESAFIVQPTPMYNYELSRHPFPVPEWHQYTRIGYPVLKSRLDIGSIKENVIWCADIQNDIPANVPLYVDPVHYAAPLQRMIAECIVGGLEKDGIVNRLRGKKKP